MGGGGGGGGGVGWGGGGGGTTFSSTELWESGKWNNKFRSVWLADYTSTIYLISDCCLTYSVMDFIEESENLN